MWWILTFSFSAGQLIRLPFLDGGITLLDISVFLLTIWALFKLKFKLNNPPFLKPALLFILIALFSLIATPAHLNLNEFLNAFSYIVRFFLYLLFAVSISSLKKDFSKSLIVSGFVISVLGFLQIIFFPDLRFLADFGWDPHYFRLVSTFLDPNFTGAFLILTLLVHLGGGPGRTPRGFYFIFAIIYLALLTTFSRSSYLMFLASGITLSFFQKSKKLFIFTIILFLILMGGFKIYTQLIARPRNIDRTKSASFRLNTWQQGFTLFQKYPILGVGFNTYRYAINEYHLGDEQFLKSHGSSSNDSSLLFVAATTGLLGLFSYLYFLFTLLNKRNTLIFVALAGLIIHSFFANSLFYPPILLGLLAISVAPKK